MSDELKREMDRAHTHVENKKWMMANPSIVASLRAGTHCVVPREPLDNVLSDAEHTITQEYCDEAGVPHPAVAHRYENAMDDVRAIRAAIHAAPKDARDDR